MIPFLSSIILCIHHPSFFQCGPFMILSVQYKRKVLYKGDKLWRLTWQEDIFHNPSPPICILDGKIHHLQCNQETDNPSNKLHFFVPLHLSESIPEQSWKSVSQTFLCNKIFLIAYIFRLMHSSTGSGNLLEQIQ